jgi:hypothetical protein
MLKQLSRLRRKKKNKRIHLTRNLSKSTRRVLKELKAETSHHMTIVVFPRRAILSEMQKVIQPLRNLWRSS